MQSKLLVALFAALALTACKKAEEAAAPAMEQSQEAAGEAADSAAEAADVPYAAQLLQIPGVVQVFVLNDFITVTRDPSADWNAILPQAEEIIKNSL